MHLPTVFRLHPNPRTVRNLVTFAVATIALGSAQEIPMVAPLADTKPTISMSSSGGLSDYLGLGLDSVTGALRAKTCVGFKRKTEPDDGGQQTLYDKRQIKTQEDILHSFGLSASATFRFGVGSASAALDYARDFQLSRSKETLGILEAVYNPDIRGFEPQLTQTALYAAGQGAAEFFKACGDSYIIGVKTGGFLSIFATFTSETSAESTTSKGTVSINTGRGDGTVSMTESLRRAIQNSTADVKIFRNGTHDSIPADRDLESYARSFPPKVSVTSGKAVILGYEPSAYSDFTELKDVFRSLRAQKDVLDLYARTVLEDSRIINEIDTVIADQWKYAGTNQKELSAIETSAQAQIKYLTVAARACYDNLPSECKVANIDSSLSARWILAVPEYKFSTKLYTGVGSANFGMLSTDPSYYGPTRFAGYALAHPDSASDMFLYVGNSVWPCVSTRIYGSFGGPPMNCMGLIGWASSAANGHKQPLYIGIVPDWNYGHVNTDSSFNFPINLKVSAPYGFLFTKP